MLTEKRQEEIVRLVYERESITVAELKEILHSSESTIRRDIIALDQEGRLTKVFGGAIALRTAQIVNKELSMVQKKDLQIAEKQAIARYAASLIERDDCVYLDAGTSTGWMIEYIREAQARRYYRQWRRTASADRFSAGVVPESQRKRNQHDTGYLRESIYKRRAILQ